MRIVTGSGRNAKSVEIATGHAFRSRSKDDQRAVVQQFCSLAGIPFNS